MKNHKPLLFSIQDYGYMLDRMCNFLEHEKGGIEVKHFPDGERYQRLLTDVDDREVILVAGLHSDEATLEAYDLACALVKHGARGLTLIVPYYAYSTMERTVKFGEIITAKTRARLISSIPIASNGNRIVLMDLHVPALTHYFEGEIIPTHLTAQNVVLDAIKKLGGDKFVIASTDAGRAKWVEGLANALRMDAAFVFKKRIDGEKTILTAMNAHVEGAQVVIYDDMIRTGGSLINAAKAYRDAGAAGVSAIATHGVLPGQALERIRESGSIDKLVITDTHPNSQKLKDPFLEVISVAEIFADYINDHF